MKPVAGAAPVTLLWGLPLCLSLLFAAQGAYDAEAWRAMLVHPQLWPALALSLWTGTASTVLAMVMALTISAAFYRSNMWNRLQAWSGAGLALPHLAFAIGLGFFIMPSGILARIVVGSATPPQWVTTQDPLGLSLIAALTLKEIPFLVAMIWSLLTRGDVARALDGQWRAARSLGHAPGSVWQRIVQPQLLRRLVWPLVIVWVYGATVVDMALVLGPTQPPVLSVLVWKDLNDADAAINARGLAGAVFLSLVLALVGLAIATLIRLAWRTARPSLSAGPSLLRLPAVPGFIALSATGLVYGLVVTVLVVMSIAARWPYPDLWPEQFKLTALAQFAGHPAPLIASLALAVATTASALAMAVLWFETQSEKHDRWLLAVAVATLALPQIVVATGQYRLFLQAELTGTAAGLFLAHLPPVFAYVAIVLTGPYRALDRRYIAVARSLGTATSRRWWRITAPLLRGPLLMAAAIGLSVSMVQFVPAQLVAAGRHATLPMEAVTLSSGGNRALTATYALALALPPLLAFILAGRFGRTRWA